MWFKTLSTTSLIVACLAGCEATTPKKASDLSTLDQIDKALLQTVEPAKAELDLDEALMPALPSEPPVESEERFDINVNQVDAKTFFLSLVKGTDYNIVVHPEVKGKISLDLRQVTMEQVLDTVRSIYGFAFQRNGNIYKIYANGLQTQMFHINYLNVSRNGQSSTSVSAGQISDLASSSSDSGSDSESKNSAITTAGTKITTETKTDFWGQLRNTLNLFIAKKAGQSIIVSPQTGIVVARALPDEIVAIESYLKQSQLILQRQVVLEAKILEVELNDGFQTGVNWQALGEVASNKSLTTRVGSPISGITDLVDPQRIGGAFRLDASLNDFNAVIQLLEGQGNVQVLSSPKISTINNQKAVIKVGSDEFFVTEVKNNTTTSTNGNTQNAPEVELTPFFSGIALDVTPQISEDEEVILHIHPSISRVTETVKNIQITNSDNLVLPLATSTIRETDSIVYAKSGEVVVIGGLMSSRSEEKNSGAPGLQDMPVLGHLFKQKNRSLVKTELVILLKPRIIDADGWGEVMGQSAKGFNSIRSLIQTQSHLAK